MKSKTRSKSVPGFRYTLAWNFGKAQCNFDHADLLARFVRDELPRLEQLRKLKK